VFSYSPSTVPGKTVARGKFLVIAFYGFLILLNTILELLNLKDLILISDIRKCSL
jgi:hypothetical protein